MKAQQGMEEKGWGERERESERGREERSSKKPPNTNEATVGAHWLKEKRAQALDEIV